MDAGGGRRLAARLREVCESSATFAVGVTLAWSKFTGEMWD